MSPRQQLNRVVTVLEAAYYVGVSDRTIRRWCEDGLILARGTEAGWLILMDDLENIRKNGKDNYLSMMKAQSKGYPEQCQKPLF